MRRTTFQMTDLEIHFLGVDIRRPQDHRIDRPRGTGDWLMVHFRTPIHIRDTAGTRSLPPGAGILFSPGRPQWYHGTGGGYSIDYCHFSGSGVGSLIRRFGIPTNRAFRPARPEPLAALLRGLAAEYLRHDAHWHEICSLMLAHILIAFGRGATGIPDDGLTPRQSQLAERLRDLRMRIHQELQARWTIASMAAVAHLSPSRFSHVYRQHFGLSPMDDLIDARVAHARWLLASEPVAVKEAAAECGFCDVHYFSRVFRSRTGCSPQAFARRRASGTRKAAAPEAAVENLRVRRGDR